MGRTIAHYDIHCLIERNNRRIYCCYISDFIVNTWDFFLSEIKEFPYAVTLFIIRGFWIFLDKKVKSKLPDVDVHYQMNLGQERQSVPKEDVP